MTLFWNIVSLITLTLFFGQLECQTTAGDETAGNEAATTDNGRNDEPGGNRVERSAFSGITSARNCDDVLMNNKAAKSGIYTMNGDSGSFTVYCDIAGGKAWTVVQRRMDGSVNFRRSWAEYKSGFGYPSGEFWIGNDHLASLTADNPMILRIDLGDSSGNRKHAEYNEFKIGNEAEKYRLVSVGVYSGNAGDAMTFHSNEHFSTYDEDNDHWDSNCAKYYNGGWWYKDCHQANLNGDYNNKGHSMGINWVPWLGFYKSLTFTEMKIRSA